MEREMRAPFSVPEMIPQGLYRLKSSHERRGSKKRTGAIFIITPLLQVGLTEPCRRSLPTLLLPLLH